MCKRCKTTNEFVDAIKNGEDTIYVEGDLKNQVYRIKATGKVTCVALIIALTVTYIAIYKARITKNGADKAMAIYSGVTALGMAATSLGSVVVPTIVISTAAGGVGVLNALWDKYEIVEKNEEYIKLKRKQGFYNLARSVK